MMMEYGEKTILNHSSISLGRGTGKIVTRVRQTTIECIYISDRGLGNIDPEDMIKQIFGPSVRFID